jgi:pectate lyase
LRRKKQKSPQREKTTEGVDMAISDVQLKNNYYQVYDGSGKKIKESHSSSVGELCGIGMDFMVFLKNNYFATYDESFKKIKEVHSSSVGNFKSAAGTTVNFIKNNYLGTYDKNFKKISERHI